METSNQLLDFGVFSNLLQEMRELRKEQSLLRVLMSQLLEKDLDNQILTPNEVYSYLGIKKSTLLKLEQQGEIIPKRVGKKGLKRYLISDLNNYLKRKPKTWMRKVF